MSDQLKEMPHSKENEMMVLGCMLTNEHSLKIASTILKEEDFYHIEHQTIFRVLKSLFQDRNLADTHLICEELKKTEKLKSVGGAAYITSLAQFAGTSAYVEEYIDDIKENSKQRQLLYLAQKIEQQALEKKDSSQIITELQEEIKRIEKNRGSRERFPIQFLNQFDRNFLTEKPPEKPMLLEYSNEKGITNGFLPKSIVAMLIGAGGVGKTHLLAQLAIAISTGTLWLDTFTTTEHCGKDKRGNVFFGLGENQYDDIHRILYKASKKIRTKQPDILEEDPLQEASRRIAPFSFCGQHAAFLEDGKPSLYFKQLKAKLIEIAPKEGWSLIILDPVSRLMGADAETDNAAATQFISLLEELTIELPGNPTILFAHHTNKKAIEEGEDQDQTALRGASALTDGARLQMNLIKTKTEQEVSVLKMTKSNFTRILEKVYLEKDSDGCLQKSIQPMQTKPKTQLKKNAPPTEF